MSLEHQLLQVTIDYLPEDRIEDFRQFVKEKNPSLYESLSTNRIEPSKSLLKTVVDSDNISDINVLVDRGIYTEEDACIMSAQRNKLKMTMDFLDRGVKPTQELFNASCIGGNLQLAQLIEKRLSGSSQYNESGVYQLDYNIPLFVSILKKHYVILQWLMNKELAPDFVTISQILPRVNDTEIVNMVVNATPTINRELVTKYLDQLNQPSYTGLVTATAYCKWDIVEKNITIKDTTSEQNVELAGMLIRGNAIKLLAQWITKMTASELHQIVSNYLLDCSSIEMFRFVKSLSDVDDGFVVRAAFKVGDTETLQIVNVVDHPLKSFEGMVLGNRLSDVREFIECVDWKSILTVEIISQLMNYASPSMLVILKNLLARS